MGCKKGSKEHAKNEFPVLDAKATGAASSPLGKNYEVSFTDLQAFSQSIADVVDQVVADGRVDVLSISYGITDTTDHCGESWLRPEDRLRGERALQNQAGTGTPATATLPVPLVELTR